MQKHATACAVMLLDNIHLRRRLRSRWPSRVMGGVLYRLSLFSSSRNVLWLESRARAKPELQVHCLDVRVLSGRDHCWKIESLAEPAVTGLGQPRPAVSPGCLDLDCVQALMSRAYREWSRAVHSPSDSDLSKYLTVRCITNFSCLLSSLLKSLKMRSLTSWASGW